MEQNYEKAAELLLYIGIGYINKNDLEESYLHICPKLLHSEVDPDYLNATQAYYLATMYDFGILNAYNDHNELINENCAAYLYEIALKDNHPSAAYFLGKLYAYGNGVETDYQKAYSLYRTAQINGYPYNIDDDIQYVRNHLNQN